MEGTNGALNIFNNFVAHSLPVKITICLAPLTDIPPHMWTFNGCLGIGLGISLNFFSFKSIYEYDVEVEHYICP